MLKPVSERNGLCFLAQFSSLNFLYLLQFSVLQNVPFRCVPADVWVAGAGAVIYLLLVPGVAAVEWAALLPS